MSTTATNLASAATNLTTGTDYNSTNLFLLPHYCPFASGPFNVILLMAVGVIVGSVGLFCYQRSSLPPEKTKDIWELAKILGMGAAAVALVPAFLRTVSSNLIAETETSFEAKLVFIAFCVAATVAAKKFIGTLPEKLLNLVNKVADQTAEAQNDIQKVATAVAERTAKPLQEPPPNRINIQPTVQGYDWKELLLIRAFKNPKYPVGRTVTGLALDTGLTVTEVHRYLQKLQNNGDANVFADHPTKGPLWHLTQLGSQKFSGIQFEGGSDTIVEVGLE